MNEFIIKQGRVRITPSPVKGYVQIAIKPHIFPEVFITILPGEGFEIADCIQRVAFEVEPKLSRGTFQSKYITPKDSRGPQPKHNGPRLLDCITVVFHDGFTHEGRMAENEWAVVDLKTREKAFIEPPKGTDVDQIKRMIDSHFVGNALRVADRIWAV